MKDTHWLESNFKSSAKKVEKHFEEIRLNVFDNLLSDLKEFNIK